jgi:hypothetical protein
MGMFSRETCRWGGVASSGLYAVSSAQEEAEDQYVGGDPDDRGGAHVTAPRESAGRQAVPNARVPPQPPYSSKAGIRDFHGRDPRAKPSARQRPRTASTRRRSSGECATRSGRRGTPSSSSMPSASVVGDRAPRRRSQASIRFGPARRPQVANASEAARGSAGRRPLPSPRQQAMGSSSLPTRRCSRARGARCGGRLRPGTSDAGASRSVASGPSTD